jgi:hypothetical protein
MQRMRLHTSGVKVPKLGSLHDRLFRNFLIKEAGVEISRARFSMLQAMVTPELKSESAKSSWIDEIKGSWDTYLARVLLYDIPKESPKERALRDYYDKVISKVRPVVTKNKKTGNLTVQGIDPKLL